MGVWKRMLRADPTYWLLGEEPAVRYWTLIDILDHPPEDSVFVISLPAVSL